jgi:hypothetical protein
MHPGKSQKSPEPLTVPTLFKSPSVFSETQSIPLAVSLWEIKVCVTHLTYPVAWSTYFHFKREGLGCNKGRTGWSKTGTQERKCQPVKPYVWHQSSQGHCLSTRGHAYAPPSLLPVTHVCLLRASLGEGVPHIPGSPLQPKASHLQLRTQFLGELLTGAIHSQVYTACYTLPDLSSFSGASIQVSFLLSLMMPMKKAPHTPCQVLTEV